jgi:peptide/nickel transport system substrate-binding protein
VVIKANYGYWGGEEPWDKVTFKILTSPAGRVAALLSNGVELIETVPTADITKLSTNKQYSLVDKVSNRVIYVHLNQSTEKSPPFVTGKDGKPLDKNPFRDVRVRRALSMAINRDAIVDRVMEKKAVAAAQLLPDFFYGTSKKLKPAKFDPEGAKKLLAEAGYPNGFAMTLHGPNNRYINDANVVQALAQFYSRIAIDAKVETMPSNVYFTRATKRVWLYGARREPSRASRAHPCAPCLQPTIPRRGWESPTADDIRTRPLTRCCQKPWSRWTTRSARP